MISAKLKGKSNAMSVLYLSEVCLSDIPVAQYFHYGFKLLCRNRDRWMTDLRATFTDAGLTHSLNWS